MWYPKGNNLIIQAFTDADWAGSIDDRKSTSGETFYLGGCLVSWLSKKQTSISLSKVELEYIAAASCCTQVLWMKQTLQDLQVQFSELIPIFCDKTSAIRISKNPIMHSKTKQILINYNFVREQVAENNIKLEYVCTKEQISDIFTKPLPCESFEYLRQKLGILPSSRYIFPFQEYKAGVEVCTGLQDDCVSTRVEVCTGLQDGCVSGGVTLCH